MNNKSMDLLIKIVGIGLLICGSLLFLNLIWVLSVIESIKLVVILGLFLLSSECIHFKSNKNDSQLRFKAEIPEKNATIIFSFEDLLNSNQLFSIRELVVPWLKRGNIPEVVSDENE